MISENAWKKMINSLRSDEVISEREKAASLLEDAIVSSIRSRLPKKGKKAKMGVLFSGGVDSTTISFILKSLGSDFTCYTVGLEGAEDVEWAKRAAKRLGFRLKIRMLDDEEIEDILKKISRFLKDFDMVKAGVGCVTYAAAELAKKDGAKVIFSGLGSEEIFAGYQRHAESNDVQEECWNGLLSMYKRDIMRDVPIADKLKIKVESPLLDKEVISVAMKIPAGYKIDAATGQNKVILREVAENLGIPKEFAQRKKRAAQYGSRIDKAIERIAKKRGFKKKSDYIRYLSAQKKFK